MALSGIFERFLKNLKIQKNSLFFARFKTSSRALPTKTFSDFRAKKTVITPFAEITKMALFGIFERFLKNLKIQKNSLFFARFKSSSRALPTETFSGFRDKKPENGRFSDPFL